MDICISINLFTIGDIMSKHNIESHIKVYWNVFYALLVFTVLTVAVSYIPFEDYTFLPFGPTFWILFVGLSIACIKGYLVSYYFMHLNDESSTIYYTLLTSVFCLLVLLFMPLFWRASGESNDPQYEQYIDQDGYVTFKEPAHHDYHENGGH